MNKNTWIGIVVVLVLIILGWMFYSPKSGEAPVIETPSTVTTETKTNTILNTTTTPKPAPKVTNTFPAIFTQAGSHECTYEQTSQSSKSKNTVYIADGKMRGEFRTTDSTGKTTASMMVYNSGVLYLWTEGKGVGVRSTLKSVSDLPVAIPQDLTSGSVLSNGQNIVGWICHDWAKNNSLLAPPSYVKFQ
ncbi:MAG: hypothetical protein WAX85_01010 [Minisyncoccia bacterium]